MYLNHKKQLHKELIGDVESKKKGLNGETYRKLVNYETGRAKARSKAIDKKIGMFSHHSEFAKAIKRKHYN